jgi:hypothetical protein
MKTNTLMPLGVRGVLIAGATVAIFASLVMLAYADVAPTVTATIDNGSNTAISSAPIGTPVHASVTVASTSATTSPTGTVSFSRYDNTSCLGTATTQSGVSLTNGMASSSNFNVPATGLSYKVHYDGQSGIFSSADSSCVQVSATGSSTSLTTTLSSTSVSVGSSVSESATLAGAASNAGGSVSYVVYNDNSCSTALVGAGVRTVTNALVPNSDNVLFNNAGTYYWKAVYSGDASNNAASSSCLALSVSALATSTPTPTTTGMVVGTVYNDANTNLTKDSGENGIAGFTVHLRQGSGFGSAVFKTTTTDANGYYSFGNLNSGTYSIELVNMSPWHQDTGDYNSVALSSSTSLTENFAVHNPNNGTSTPTTTPSTISGEVYNDTQPQREAQCREERYRSGSLSTSTTLLVQTRARRSKTPFMTMQRPTQTACTHSLISRNGTYSVEEINKAGWHQDTGDYNKLVIKNGNSFLNTNFGNTAASTSTNHGDGHDNDNGNDKDNGNKGGNHNGLVAELLRSFRLTTVGSEQE